MCPKAPVNKTRHAFNVSRLPPPSIRAPSPCGSGTFVFFQIHRFGPLHLRTSLAPEYRIARSAAPLIRLRSRSGSEGNRMKSFVAFLGFPIVSPCHTRIYGFLAPTARVHAVHHRGGRSTCDYSSPRSPKLWKSFSLKCSIQHEVISKVMSRDYSGYRCFHS